MLKLTKQKLLLFGGMVLLLAGCYPSESFTVEELDLVATNYDENENYARFTTFTVPDSVVRVGGGDSDEGPGPYDELILNLVRSNMLALGYTEEKNPETNTPDLFILVELMIVNTTVVAPCWPSWGWWGGWPPYWGPGWCGGLPAIPVGQYTTGTIALSMTDVKNSDDTEQVVPVVWTAYLNGLVQSSSSGTEARITNAINQAYNQSQYLGAN